MGKFLPGKYAKCFCVIICIAEIHVSAFTRKEENLISSEKPTPSQIYDHDVRLDSNYWLFWSTNSSHVTMEIHVQTLGYVGLGLSPNGDMFPSDVIIAWVEDGQVHFKDCHTVGKIAPVEDVSEDWLLLHGEETSFGTTLKFIRKINTCDVDDMEITDDTIHVIYAYHPDDPGSVTSLPWHGASRRGAKSVMFLSSTLQPEAIGLTNDIKHYDFLNQQYELPPVTTTYRCTCFHIPDLGKKHHVIKMEANLQPENIKYLHHMVLYHCTGLDPIWDRYTYMCYENAPKELFLCRAVFTAWEIGGGPFYLPPDVGISIGDKNDPRYFVLETHYNNPDHDKGIIDSSGIRISYTPTLRPIDGGVLIAGFFVDPSQIIPPHETDFLSTGYCAAEDLRRGLPKDGINVFAVLQHSHLLAKRMTSRLFRNSTELEPLAEDNNYDFNFQETRYLKRERRVLPGDSISVECFFNSTGRTNVTLGGLATTEEMCLSFFFYYPKMPLDTCWSQPLYQTIHNDTAEAQRRMMGWNWTDPEVRRTFRKALDDSQFRHSSFGNFLEGGWKFHDKYEIQPREVYTKPEDKSCTTRQDVVLLPEYAGSRAEPTFPTRVLHVVVFVIVLIFGVMF